MVANGYVDSGDCEATSLSGEEAEDDDEDHMASELSSRTENTDDGSSLAAEDKAANKFSEETDGDVVFKASAGELVDEHPDENISELLQNDGEAMDEKQGDYSDGWLALADDQDPWEDEDGSSVWANMDNQESESSKNSAMEKELHSQYQSGPNIRTSAITGVGLQELLQIIDERLRDQDEKPNGKNVVERSMFDRKWRPPHEEEAGTAVEQ